MYCCLCATPQTRGWGLRSGMSKDKFCGRISLNLQCDFHQTCVQQHAHMRTLRPTLLARTIVAELSLAR